MKVMFRAVDREYRFVCPFRSENIETHAICGDGRSPCRRSFRLQRRRDRVDREDEDRHGAIHADRMRGLAEDRAQTAHHAAPVARRSQACNGYRFPQSQGAQSRLLAIGPFRQRYAAVLR